MNVRRLSVIMATFLALAGCHRKSNPLLGDAPSGTTGVTLFIPQIDTGHGTNENRVFVYAADQSGNSLGGFKLGNFSILEGGAPGVPFEVGPVTETLYLCLVIDRSGSMAGANTTAANAAGVALINALSSQDYAAVVDFETTVSLTVPFTRSKSTLITAINNGGPLGGTALYDAISYGASLLSGVSGRRMLIVLTDGEDTASTTDLGQSIQSVNRAGLSCYTVGLGAFTDPAVLRQIATETGGTYATSLTGVDLTTIFLGTLERFNNLYFVKYRRRDTGEIKVFVNISDFTANASKRLD